MLFRFEDGSNYKSSPLFQRQPTALQIMLYMDEVQMCNPLGSYNHKLVYVYFSLGNLPYIYRSKLELIHLVSIFYFEHTSFFSLNTMLRPIVEELKRLEVGVEMLVKGLKRTIFGTLSAVVADNLASHQLGGFKSGFSKGFRKCRTCLAVDSEIQNNFTDFQFVHRKKKDHDQQCAGMANVELANHYSWLYGIHNSSIFNELQFFHVIWGLPPDVMHDLLEGVIPRLICEVLLHLIGLKLITLDKLNLITQNFNYGHNEIRDKPSVIKLEHLTKKKLRQSASQNWLLFVYLPLMIGHLVSINDKKWECFNYLQELTRLVFKDSFFNFDIIKLGSLVSDFLTSYKKQFNQRIIPKMHHLVHYPSYIKRFGPLLPLWCMRFEGKHAYFKSVLKSTNNFINVPFTLSYRHQQWISHKMTKANGSLLKFKLTVGKLSCMSLNGFSYSAELVRFLCIPPTSPLLTVDTSSSFKINSSIYRSNESVLLLENACVNPPKKTFALLINIVHHLGRFEFVCKALKTKKFVYQLQSFKVMHDNFFLIVDPTNLNNGHIFTLHNPGFRRPKNNKEFYVVTKTCVTGTGDL